MSDGEARDGDGGDGGPGTGESLRRLAVNLYNGYGYNCYRSENQLRADDQRIRRMVAELLQRTRAALSEAESRYRRDTFPPPSRAQPFPPAEAQAAARRIEELAQTVSALAGEMAHLPVPAADAMSRRWRDEAATLRRLADQDLRLVERAQALADTVVGLAGAELVAAAGRIEAEIGAIRQALLARQTLLL